MNTTTPETPSNSTRMSFDENSHVFLIDVLTNLYSNPELAVLREYTSNGLDSHTASGQTRPVELSMPTPSNPVFVVKDYGLGMSRVELDEIYSRYGASTKRDSNTQIGGFGLGAKSALTITTSFTITSIKDGEKNVVLVAKDDDGVGSLNFILTEATDEPNGVEVAIPVRNISKFNEESENFFLGIDPAAILVNGESVENSLYNANKWVDIDGLGWFNEKELLSPSYGYGWRSSNARVKVGPAIYTLENNTGNLFERYNSLTSYNAANIVISLPIGSVDLTPSREGLRYSEKTVTAIKSSIEAYETALRNRISELLEEQATEKEASIFFQMANRNHFDLPAVWHGKEIPTNISFPEGKVWLGVAERNRKTSVTKNTFTRLSDFVSPSNNSHAIRVYFTADSDREKVGKNIKDYANAKNQSSVIAYLIKKGTKVDAWFAATVPTVGVEELYTTALEYRRNNRKASTGRTKAVAPVSYITYSLNSAGESVLGKTPATAIVGNPLYILEDDYGYGAIVRGVKGNLSAGYYSQKFEVLAGFAGNRPVVLLPSTMSTSRFLKLFPKAEPMKDFIYTEVAKTVGTLTSIEKSLVKEQVRNNTLASSIYFTRIAEKGLTKSVKNDEMRSLVELHADSEKMNRLVQLARIARVFSNMNIATLVEDTIVGADTFINFEETYPLLEQNYRASTLPVDHVVAYMNLVEDMKKGS